MSEHLRLKWKSWLYSLMVAGMGSAATTGAAALLSQELSHDFGKLGKMIMVSFAIGVLLVIKKSPMPDRETDDDPPTISTPKPPTT